MMKTDWKSIRNMVIGGFILFVLIYLYLYAGERFVNACTPLFIGLILAYVIDIIIKWLRKCDIFYNKGIIKSKRFHDVGTTVAAVMILILCIVLIGVYIAPQMTNCVITLLDKVPGGIRYLINLPIMEKILSPETLESLREIDWSNWINHLVSTVNSDDLVRSMTSTASSALVAFSSLLFGVIFTAYFLASREKIHRQLVRASRAFLPEGKEEIFFHYTGLMNSCFHDFIVCQVIQAVTIGVAATLVLWIFRFPYATMIGTLNGFCALIPVVGGYVGAILGTLMILSDAPQMAIFFLILIIVVQNVVGTFVFPRLVGQSLGLPAVWTLAAVTIGSGMLGIRGIVIGVPLTAFVYRCLKEYVKKRESQKKKEPERLGTAADAKERKNR